MFFSCLCFSRQAVLSPVPVLFPDFCFSSLAHGSVLPQAHRVLTGVSVKESTTDFSCSVSVLLCSLCVIPLWAQMHKLRSILVAQLPAHKFVVRSWSQHHWLLLDFCEFPSFPSGLSGDLTARTVSCSSFYFFHSARTIFF
jgi:hypothetical protein